VATVAALHLAACTTNFAIQKHFNHFAEAHVKAAALGNPEVVDGAFVLPQGPGLGVELDLDIVQAHPRRRIFFNLFAPEWHRRQATVEDAERSHRDALHVGRPGEPLGWRTPLDLPRFSVGARGRRRHSG
jgi:hypothetical protein